MNLNPGVYSNLKSENEELRNQSRSLRGYMTRYKRLIQNLRRENLDLKRTLRTVLKEGRP